MISNKLTRNRADGPEGRREARISLAALVATAALVGAAAGCSEDNGPGSAPDAGGSPDAGGAADVNGPVDAAVGPDGSAAVSPEGKVRWVGRVDLSTPARPRFAWSASGFVLRFSGTELAMTVNGTGLIFEAVIDGTPQPPVKNATGVVTLAAGLAAGEHTVEVYRQTEGGQGDAVLTGLDPGSGTLLDPPAAPDRLIEIIGDSISCGYGALGALADTDCFPTESAYDAYGTVAARLLGADVSTIAASGRGVIRNYDGDTTDTMPMIYARTLTNDAVPVWNFQPQPQAVVINLGTNDISNSKGDPGTAFETTYLTLVQMVRAKYPDAYIVCLNAPLLSGGDLSTINGHISAVVAMQTAAGDTRIELFDKIAPQSSDKYACQYHPNGAEHTLMGMQLATELAAKLGW